MHHIECHQFGKTLLLSIIVLCFSHQLSAQALLERYDSAIWYMDRGQFAPATEIFEDIVDSLRIDEYSEKYFEAQYYIGVCMVLYKKQPKLAEELFVSSLDEAIKWKGAESIEAAQMHFGLGWLCDNKNREIEAEKYYLKAVNIYKDRLPKTDKTVAKAQTNYAHVLVQNRKFGRAQAHLLELLDVYSKLYPKSHGEFFRLYSLAYAYYSAVNETTKSLEYALAALQLSIDNYGEDNYKTMRLIRSVVQAYMQYGDFEKSIEYGKKELEIINRLVGQTPHLWKAEILNNMGLNFKSIDYEESVKFTTEALEMKLGLLERDDPSTIRTMINLANVFITNDELEKGSQWLFEAWELVKQDTSYQTLAVRQWALSIQVEFYTRMRQVDSAAVIINRAFDTFTDEVALSNLGGIQHHNMMIMLEKLVLLSLENPVSNEKLLAIEQKLGVIDSINQEAILKLNFQSDQLTFFEYYTHFNNAAVDLYYELYSRFKSEEYLSKVVSFSEKNKATILSPEYTIARLKDQLNVPMEVLEKERMLLTKVTEKRSNTDGPIALESQLRYDSLRNYLKESYPDYFALRYDLGLPDLQEIQNQIPDDTQIIAYALTERSLYTTVISHTDTEIFSQPLDSMENLSTSFVNGITNLGAVEDLGRKLHEKLIPNRDSLKNSLVICAQDYLALLPFEMLQDGDQYLGISNVLSYTPSINMWLKNLQYNKYPNSELLAVAPDFSDIDGSNNEEVYRDELVPIPGAKEELEIVLSHYDGTSLAGGNATRMNFTNSVSDYGIIHLATHAMVDNSDPNLSRLYFTETDDMERPYIYNYELYNLDMKANLVTLSACNTGIGQLEKGEGVNSLARGFMYAGVPAVLVSLWPVSDKSTPLLMKHFYQNLADGEPKDVALRNAKKAYLSQAKGKARHPFYWAGFVLIGDNAPIAATPDRTVVWIISFSILLLLGTYLFRPQSSNS